MPGKAAPARTVAAAVEVELEQDLRVVLADLRPGDEERLAGRRALRPDEQRVRHRQPGRGRRRASSRATRPGSRRRRSRSRSSCASRTPPGPGTATFASGSSRWRRSSQTRRPASWPSLRWSRSRNSRAAHLVASSGTEDGAHQPADRDDVVARPRSDREPCTLVLGVDPGDVGVDDPDRLAALRTLRPQQRELRAEPRLRRRARPELPPGQREAEGVDARRVERRDAARAAQQLHDQLAVGRGRPARAEGDVLGGRPLDVRHAPPVAGDRDARARPLDLDRRSRPARARASRA